MYTISGKSSDEFKIKGSLFKSYTFEVNNTLDVIKYISQLEKKFPDASHICLAGVPGCGVFQKSSPAWHQEWLHRRSCEPSGAAGAFAKMFLGTQAC